MMARKTTDLTNHSLTDIFDAVRYGSVKDVKYFIEKLEKEGIDVNTKIYFGMTPLHYAAAWNSLDVVQYLLSQNVDVNATANVGFYNDENGWTPLHAAISNNSVEVVKCLILHGANVSAEVDYYWTPLHVAAYRNYFAQDYPDYATALDIARTEEIRQLLREAMVGGEVHSFSDVEEMFKFIFDNHFGKWKSW